MELRAERADKDNSIETLQAYKDLTSKELTKKNAWLQKLEAERKKALENADLQRYLVIDSDTQMKKLESQLDGQIVFKRSLEKSNE